MSTKIYFCSDCAVMLDITNEPDEGDICSNCNCDIFNNDPIVGVFDDADARHLRSLEP